MFRVSDSPIAPGLSPWTRSVELRWRPELTFYERGTDVLRTFERRGLLTSFSVEFNQITAWLKGDIEVLLSASGLVLESAAQDKTMSDLELSAKTALQIVSPQLVVETTCWLQYVTPMAGSYEEARRASGNRLYGAWWPLPIADYALLIEGDEAQIAAAYKAEVGVVSKDELPHRLARLAGRLGRLGHQPSPRPTWRGKQTLPDVALYAGWVWTSKSRPNPAEIARSVFEFANAAELTSTTALGGLVSVIASEAEKDLTK
jgi:hypothetical protein